MATSSMIPYSNPAGVNQTKPGSGTSTLAPVATGTVPAANPLQPAQVAQANPLIPASTPITSSSVTGAPAGTTTSSTVSGAAYNQLNDIYGAAGGTLTNFMNSISGTNSATLQEYIQSLAPSEATAQANVNASLGAGGVSANSSVAGLADANLQSQEFAQISSEAANLTQSQQSLEAQLIESTLPAAQKQVSDSSPLSILGDVLGDVGKGVSDVLGLGAVTGGLGSSSSFESTFGGAGAVPTATLNTTVPEPDFSLSL